MKKIILLVIAITASIGAINISAQDPDVAAIAAMRNVKADSLSIMLGKVYGTQAAMNAPTSEERSVLVKAFENALNVESLDEEFKEGYKLGTQYFTNAQGLKNRQGIELNRAAYAQAMLSRLEDTTITVNLNTEIKDINNEAKRLIGEVTELLKDSINLMGNAGLINIKSDSLSQNMGRFFGAQAQNMFKQKKFDDAKMARFIEGFNNSINVDDRNQPMIDGKMLGSEVLNISQNIKRQLQLNMNQELFVGTIKEILADPKVPTTEEFKAIDTQTQSYMREVQAFSKENSPEALTHRTMGKKYIENLLEKDPKFIQAPSGLVYKILEPGKGKQFVETDKIRVMYKGTHVDGNTFDQSKEPIAFAPNQVVPGFREALLMMRPGAKMIAVLPYNLAYGDRGAGGAIKPYETLVFEIETLGLEETKPDEKGAEAAPETPSTKVEKMAPANANKKAGAKKTKSTSTKKSKKRK